MGPRHLLPCPTRVQGQAWHRNLHLWPAAETHLQPDTFGGKQRASASAPVCSPGEAGAQRPQAPSGSCDEDLILNNACSPHLFPKRGFEGASRPHHKGSPKHQVSHVCRKPLGLSPRQMSVGAHPTQEPPAMAHHVPSGAAGGEQLLLLQTPSPARCMLTHRVGRDEGAAAGTAHPQPRRHYGPPDHHATYTRPPHRSAEELDQPLSRGRSREAQGLVLEPRALHQNTDC